MRILGPTDYRVMPWKNGGGTTTEIMIWPEGAQVARPFDWRISMADVAQDGSFSRFDGYERSLVVISGAGIRLSSPSFETIELRRGDEAFRFMGDEEISCSLIAGPIRDFNVISRCTGDHRVRAHLREISSASPSGPSMDADVAVIHVLSGQLRIGDAHVTEGGTVVMMGAEVNQNASEHPLRAIVATISFDRRTTD